MVQDTLDFFIKLVEQGGYVGIFFSMIPEGLFLPLPIEELVLPLSGYLASRDELNMVIVILVATLAATVGASLSYGAARYLGKPALLKYGKHIFLHKADLERGERIFHRHGIWIVVVSRLIPGVRGVVPLAAGIAHMRFSIFAIYTFVGSLIPISTFVFIGYMLGENYRKVSEYVERTDTITITLVVIALILGIFWWKMEHPHPLRAVQVIRHKSYMYCAKLLKKL